MNEYIYEKYINRLIKTNKDGKRIVDEKDISLLNISDKEKEYIKELIKKDSSLILKSELEPKKDRPKRVSDYVYGEKEGYETRKYEEASLAKTEYSAGELIFGDFEKLVEFLENKFIPENVKLTRKRGEKTCVSSIQLNKLVRLRLSEEEMQYALNYLGAQGIRVGGYDESLEGEFDNYDFIRTYKTGGNKARLLDPTTQRALVVEYKKYPDDKYLDEKTLKEKRKLRNRIIESIMRLVPYAAWKYSYLFGYDIDDLCQEGYASLFDALEDYDITKRSSLSTYAFYRIKNAMYKNMSFNLTGTRNNDTYNFLIAKREVEKSNNTNVKEHPELFEDIVNVMIGLGSYPDKARNFVHKSKLNLSYVSIEDDTKEIDEKLVTTPEYYTIPSEIKVDLSDTIEKILSRLSPRERLVIEKRMGFDGNRPMTLDEVGEVIGVTRERVRQIEQKALRTLRRCPKIKPTEEQLQQFEKMRDNEGFIDSFGISENFENFSPMR